MDTRDKQLIRMELVKCRDEGCDVATIESRVREALADDATDDAVFVGLYDALDALAPEPSFPSEPQRRTASPRSPQR